MFDLSLEEEKIMFEETGYVGKIVINEFEESFFASNSFFKKEDYYKNWIKSIDRFFEIQKTFLLTNVYDPRRANFYMAWVCYLVNNVVYVQNTIIFRQNYCLKEVLHSNVEIDNIEFIGDEGKKISTWKTDVKSINDLKNRLIRKLS